jgi:two-component system response regulator
MTEMSEKKDEIISLLFIEDDKTLQFMGKKFLEQNGFLVTTAGSAHEAINQIGQTSYDIIISDYDLPDMDGIRLLKHLKESGDTTPFILLTGKGGEEVVIEALNSGAAFYIVKRGDPVVQFSDLSNKIEYAVARTRTEKKLIESQKSNEKAIETLKIYDFALTSSLTGSAIIDLNGIITFVNPAILKMWGYDTPDEVLGKQAISFWQNPDEADKAFSLVQETGYWAGEMVPLRKDGENTIVIGSITLILDQSKIPVGIIASCIDITEKRKLEEQIKASLIEKEILLREIHHRVKNNLQIISSLLNMQTRQIDHPETCEVLRDSQNRVKTMALVHENLYQGEDMANINLESYFRSLGQMLLKSYQVDEKKISFELFSKKLIVVDINIAIPLGLIANEIFTNSLKYGFCGKDSGKITISISEEAKQITITISDDGVGIGEVILTNPTTLGLQLINGLTRQLRGTLKINGQIGTTVTLIIPNTIKSIK